MVAGHQRHARRREDAHLAESAAVEHHLKEAGVVARGGEQPRSAREADAGALHVLSLAPHARTLGRAGQPAGRHLVVDGGEPAALGGRQIEVRVAHVEGLEDARAQEVVQRLPGNLLDQRPEDVGVVAVDESLAGLGLEGQRRHAVDGRAHGLGAVGEVPSGDARLGPARPSRPRAVADPRRVGEEVPDRDRPLRRDDLLDLARPPHRDRRALEGRQVCADGIGDQKRPVLLKQHHRHAHHRLRLRGDAEDRVGPERASALEVGEAGGVLVGQGAVAQDRHHRTRQPAPGHVVVE